MRRPQTGPSVSTSLGHADSGSLSRDGTTKGNLISVSRLRHFLQADDFNTNAVPQQPDITIICTKIVTNANRNANVTRKNSMKTSSVIVWTSSRLLWNTCSYGRDKLSATIQEIYRPILHSALSTPSKVTKIRYTLIPHCIRIQSLTTRYTLLRYLNCDIRRSNNGADGRFKYLSKLHRVDW